MTPAIGRYPDDGQVSMGGDVTGAVADEFGIDELARQAGTTVRNVRLYQERGLLPRPRREGRAAFYGDHHLTRLRLVLRLIARGYSLAAIKDLGDAWDAQHDLGQVLGLDDVLARRLSKEEPIRIDVDELLRRFPPAAEADPEEAAALLERAITLEMFVPDGDEFVVPSPTLLNVGEQMVQNGVPLSTVLDVLADIRTTTTRLAGSFIDMFVEHIWSQFEAAGEPANQTDEMVASITGYRQIAERAVVIALAQAMQVKTDEAIMSGLGTSAKSAAS